MDRRRVTPYDKSTELRGHCTVLYQRGAVQAVQTNLPFPLSLSFSSKRSRVKKRGELALLARVGPLFVSCPFLLPTLICRSFYLSANRARSPMRELTQASLSITTSFVGSPEHHSAWSSKCESKLPSPTQKQRRRRSVTTFCCTFTP